jgi:hypothetical protein
MADRQTMLLDSIRGFVRAQLAGEQVGTLLDQLVQEVVRILDVIGAGVSLGDTDGVLRFVVASDPLTLRAERRPRRAPAGRRSWAARRSGARTSHTPLSAGRTSSRWRPGWGCVRSPGCPWPPVA